MISLEMTSLTDILPLEIRYVIYSYVDINNILCHVQKLETDNLVSSKQLLQESELLAYDNRSVDDTDYCRIVLVAAVMKDVDLLIKYSHVRAPPNYRKRYRNGDSRNLSVDRLGK